ncbi:hypothetical protein [Novosphingobium sp. KN65.2]|uniref:hypothetical protein n=1 Tax=Novosphingobium sp. KN65.2 TaxID=1478134 RepID=UPI0005E646B4|nr:hypothetical protein [Novosphingobium sp. KN65.2]CDO34765.1 hypothetical protein SPHV1_1990001 [Novosphingobium sp. KN65.2]
MQNWKPESFAGKLIVFGLLLTVSLMLAGCGVVVLTRPEYEEAVANSIRLERVRQWGQSLITEGLAVPVAEFGLSTPQRP